MNGERREPASTTGPSATPTVVHLIDTVEHGGTERFLCRLLAELAAWNDMRHVVCTLRHAGDRADTLPPSVEVVSLNAKGSDRWTFLRLARFLRAANPDILHARNWGTWTDAVLATGLAPRVRLLLGYHGSQSGDAFTRSQLRRGRLLGLHRRRFTTVSHAARHCPVYALGCEPDQVTVIANGVDLERFPVATSATRRRARARLGLAPDAFAIGCVGNFFSAVKGHSVLIEAFARLAGDMAQARLVLTGFGPLHRDLQAMATQLAVSERVMFTGAVEDSAAVLPAMDLYVCPSLSEGLSNAVLEAMATGLPCVLTDVSDHRRMLGATAGEFIVPPGRPDALAAAIRLMASDAALRERSGSAARAVVEADYALRQTVLGYRGLYRSTLGLDDATGNASDGDTTTSRSPGTIARLRRRIEREYGCGRGWIRHHAARFSALCRLPERIDWARVRRLVFVCKGNVCRSPYAELYAARVGLEALSFGLDISANTAPDDVALRMARERGVRLGNRRPRPLNEYEPAAGDLVLAMEPGQERELRARLEGKQVQYGLLGSWRRPIRPHLQDPYGLGEEYCRRCFNLIEAAVDRIVRRIEWNHDAGHQTPTPEPRSSAFDAASKLPASR